MRELFDTIQPIVLVGGRSTRFGRDKLREPLTNGSWLVDRPIAALREVFGSRVALVGDCDPAVAVRGDRIIRDAHSGTGPAGGILSALSTGTDVFVLPGDVPNVTADVVRHVLRFAAAHPDALAVLGQTERIEPCIGLYRGTATELLAAFLARRRGRLADALPRDRVASLALDPRLLHNANVPNDLRAAP